MAEALIIDAVRTPIGRYGGALAAARPDDLAARVVEAAVRRTGLDPSSVGIKGGGDLIVKAAGKDIEEPDGLIAAIVDKKPGDEIDIEYYRGRDKKTATITLANRPSNVGSSEGGGGGGGGRDRNPPFQIP